MTTQTMAITADANLSGTLTCSLFTKGGHVALYTGTVTKLSLAVVAFRTQFFQPSNRLLWTMSNSYKPSPSCSS
jgi:hypothetical protein